MSGREQVRRQLVVEDESGRRFYFPLGILSRPRVIPDPRAEDGLLRDWIRARGIMGSIAFAVLAGGLICYVQQLYSMSIVLLLTGMGGLALGMQWQVRQTSRSWECQPRWSWTRWLRLRGAGQSRSGLWMESIAWALLLLVGVQILRTGQADMQLLGWLQAGISGVRLALNLGLLVFRPRTNPDPPVAC